MSGRGFKEAEARQKNEAAFHSWIAPVVDELKALYGSGRSREEKLRLREEVFAHAKQTYRERFPPRPGQSLPYFLRVPLNNALIMAFSVYHQDTPEHRRLYARLFNDLPALIRLYKHAADSYDHPILYLKSL